MLGKFVESIYLNTPCNISGGQNDDGRRADIRRVLVAFSPLLHHHIVRSEHHNAAVYPGDLLGHLLAGDEQQHVQSDHLLLDEPSVSDIL